MIQVGKGRDVGLAQITAFEAKVAMGAANVCFSREASRLEESMDTFTAWSSFFGGIGHYVLSCVMVATIEYMVVLMLVSAVMGWETVGNGMLISVTKMAVSHHNVFS